MGARDLQSDTDTDNSFFLPNLCTLAATFTVAVLAEVFAIVLALAQQGKGTDVWRDLAMFSLFCQWVGILSAAMLCLGRHLLGRLGSATGAVISYLLLLFVVALISSVSFNLAIYASLPLATDDAGAFMLHNLLIGALVGALALRYLYIQHQWKRRLQVESQARVQALQARIRPHFLFNSMNTIASLIHDDPDAAEAATEDLSDLFRASIGDSRPLHRLEEELSLARHYIHIEQLRLGERLTVHWNVDKLPGDALLPPLTLQPLLENAVYHGIEPRTDGGAITVTGTVVERRLELVVSNPLPGAGGTRHEGGNRMALANISERLALHFPGQSSLEQEVDEQSYRVQLSVPYRRAK